MKRNKEQEQQLFDAYQAYNDARAEDSFIKYDKLIASVLLKNNISFNSEIYIKFVEKMTMAINKHYDLLFRDFVITFNVNGRFGNDLLVPMIANFESSNNEAINFREALTNDTKASQFLYDLNNEIARLLNQKSYVEIFPNIILYISPNTEHLKLLFSRETVSKLVTPEV
ncbi:Protein of uncharacterised function (DUF2714) [Metamycoplasma arthritidis]|uniref:DUF2714 domain-containing protein n=1 Tax=Metamycoplasma arthritidis (strain 158L3-1) TaxID=243272 RepID=B3PMA5_META1|nr:DUF2714 domain-containing protein [Metamycoplasma arthritidis]ACF07157.1 conserved hypothetical protein [Metamycoplasma arthritidis 158L3-1]VEU78682.1 Protein of uncharacterised function (DUF2714) [Metamycoplasma arthritidis]